MQKDSNLLASGISMGIQKTLEIGSVDVVENGVWKI